jgi:hypothetical protein
MSECAWSTGDVILTKETEVLGVKPVLVPLCPPQIPHEQTSDGNASSQLPKTWNKQLVFLFNTQFDLEFKMKILFHIIPKWKLGCFLNPMYYVLLFEIPENFIFREEHVASLKEH